MKKSKAALQIKHLQNEQLRLTSGAASGNRPTYGHCYDCGDDYPGTMTGKPCPVCGQKLASSGTFA